MERCRMVTYEQLLEWQKQQESFQPLPVWLERNERYTHGEHWPHFEPTVITSFDEDIDELEDASAYMLGGPSYEIRSYNKSWRLWFACNAEIPDFDAPWELFSWDKGKGDHA